MYVWPNEDLLRYFVFLKISEGGGGVLPLVHTLLLLFLLRLHRCVIILVQLHCAQNQASVVSCIYSVCRETFQYCISVLCHKPTYCTGCCFFL